MTQVKFVRTTHVNGHYQSQSTEAMTFWREHGAIVGETLRPESPMSLSEIIVASQEYTLEYPETSPDLPLDETYIAWCLVKLLEYGLAGVVATAVETEQDNGNI